MEGLYGWDDYRVTPEEQGFREGIDCLYDHVNQELCFRLLSMGMPQEDISRNVRVALRSLIASNVHGYGGGSIKAIVKAHIMATEEEGIDPGEVVAAFVDNRAREELNRCFKEYPHHFTSGQKRVVLERLLMDFDPRVTPESVEDLTRQYYQESRGTSSDPLDQV